MTLHTQSNPHAVAPREPLKLHSSFPGLGTTPGPWACKTPTLSMWPRDETGGTVTLQKSGWWKMEYKYPAIRSRQSEGAPWLLQFSAPASDIKRWAGIPQKRRLDFGDSGGETTGFQREFNESRRKSLAKFFSHDENVIQNPLLCAMRDSEGTTVRFEHAPHAGGGTAATDSNVDPERQQVGFIIIEESGLAQRPLVELLGLVRSQLESRMPHLAGKIVPEDAIAKVKASHNSEADLGSEDGDSPESAELEQPTEQSGESEATTTFTEESHLQDFWIEVAAREEALKELGSAGESVESCAGYDRAALLGFLLPVVLVDGQHRLMGAIGYARAKLEGPPWSDQIANSEDPTAEGKRVERQLSRLLPISLLESAETAEHVFQFVVVNQKATPIGRALLGTIVATTLSNKELELVRSRLRDSGIEIEEAQSVAFMTRTKSSPFYELAERGYERERGSLLQWNVLAKLVLIFKELQGGALFHQAKDFSAIWRDKYLPESTVVGDFEAQGFDSPHSFWSSSQGPWREVFMSFWTNVRDRLSKNDDQSPAYWGSPRTSNLFNKVSLTILAADFFRFLNVSRQGINSTDVSSLVNDWLTDIDCEYFNRNWRLREKSVKKDSPGIRKRWSKVWAEYRETPDRLPRVENYSKPLGQD